MKLFRFPRLIQAVKEQAQEDIADMFAHDATEKHAIHRAAIAERYGLKPTTEVAVGRPWKSDSTVNDNRKTESSGIGMIAAGLMGAGTMLGGLGIGGGSVAYLMSQLNKPSVPAAVPVTPPGDSKVHPSEYKIKLRVKDGKLAPIESTEQK